MLNLVLGVGVFSLLPMEIRQFSPPFGAISLLNYTVNLEKREQKKHWRKFKKSSGDSSQKLQISVPCRGRLCPEQSIPPPPPDNPPYFQMKRPHPFPPALDPAPDKRRDRGTPQARRRQLRASSGGSSDATSKASFPLHNAEARQHQGNLDVTSDVVLSCCCCPSAGADENI